MRIILLFRLFTHLSLGILVVNGLECHTSIPRHEKRSTRISNELLEILDGPVRDLCHKAQELNAADKQVSYSTSSGWTFQIHRDSAVQSVKECLAAFSKIINGCVKDQNVKGGEILSEATDYFLTYMNDDKEEEHLTEGVFEDENESTAAVLEVRDPKGNRGSRPRPSQPRPSQPRPNKPISPKPKPTNSSKPKPPISKTRKPVTSKPLSTIASRSASKTSSSVKPTITKSCKQLALMDRKALLNARDMDVEYSAMHPHTPVEALEERDGVQKRASKRGSVCSERIGRRVTSWKFNARDYPERGTFLANHPNARYYGFTDPYNCKSYQWSANSQYEPQRVGETEHVLEWQSVTGFIDWLNARYKSSGTQFQDPDTTSNQPLSFCKYIIKYWDLHTGNNQASQYTFAINNGAAMNPVEHLASVYPSNDPAHSHEFVLLQSDINAPAKANVSIHVFERYVRTKLM